jgi:hypothetical protein
VILSIKGATINTIGIANTNAAEKERGQVCKKSHSKIFNEFQSVHWVAFIAFIKDS